MDHKGNLMRSLPKQICQATVFQAPTNLLPPEPVHPIEPVVPVIPPLNTAKICIKTKESKTKENVKRIA